MMMAMRPVHMTVRNFFFSGSANFCHGKCKAQGLSGQRMVAIKQDRLPLDRHHGKHTRTPVRTLGLKLPADLDTRRKVRLLDDLGQTLVTLAKGVLRQEIECRLVP